MIEIVYINTIDFSILNNLLSSASDKTIDMHDINLFCTNQTSSRLMSTQIPHSLTTLIGLFVLHSGISMGFIAFITLGLIYVDDNSVESDSPALIGKCALLFSFLLSSPEIKGCLRRFRRVPPNRISAG